MPDEVRADEPLESFRAYLRVLAASFALNLVRKSATQRRRQEKALPHLPQPDRIGPTAEQIQAARQELASLLPPSDMNKLLQIWDPQGIPNRTIRQWRADLYAKYGHLF